MEKMDMGVEVNEDYLLGGSIVEVLYIFSWKQAVVLGKAVSESDEDDKDYNLVWLIGDEVENFSVKDVRVHKTLIRRCTRKVSRLSFLQSLCDQNLLSDQQCSTLEEEEERRGSSLQFLLSLPPAMRTWVWDNEIEIEEKEKLPFESSQEEEEASFASSSMASCSASTPYVPTCGCVKDIDFESEYYFSDAESVCG
nr:hypothetical protein CFP56_29230 [Quercus suber]